MVVPALVDRGLPTLGTHSWSIESISDGAHGDIDRILTKMKLTPTLFRLGHYSVLTESIERPCNCPTKTTC